MRVIFILNHFITGASTIIKGYQFFDDFICGYLLLYGDARKLIALREIGARRFLCFLDLDKISSVYCDYKENSGKSLGRDLKMKKDNFKTILKYFEKEGSLKKFSLTNVFDGREQIEYQVNNEHLWDSLRKHYAVKRSRHRMVI